MVIPQPKEGEMLHGLCLHLASFSTRMGSWCSGGSGGSCVSQVVSPNLPPPCPYI